jgi:hypothetical protein
MARTWTRALVVTVLFSVQGYAQQPNPGPPQWDPDFVDRMETLAKPISIREGARTSVELSLTRREVQK